MTENPSAKIEWRFPGLLNYVTQEKRYINISISTDLIKMMGQYKAGQAEIIERALRAYLLMFPQCEETLKNELDIARLENIKRRAPMVIERKNIKPPLPIDLINWLDEHHLNKSAIIEAALWEVLKPG